MISIESKGPSDRIIKKEGVALQMKPLPAVRYTFIFKYGEFRRTFFNLNKLSTGCIIRKSLIQILAEGILPLQSCLYLIL